MEKPNSVEHLAKQLAGQKFDRILALSDLIGEDATNFMDGLDFVMGDAFPRYIPIVRESVSIKKHDFNTITHVIFWLDDGQPYIYTPTPTIEFVRQGMKNQKLNRGSHLMIPHNCSKFDLLTIRWGRCNQTDSEILNLDITRHKK